MSVSFVASDGCRSLQEFDLGGVVSVLGRLQREVSQVYRLGQEFVDSDKRLLAKYAELYGEPNSFESVTRAGRYLRAKGLFSRSVSRQRQCELLREGYLEYYKKK